MLGESLFSAFKHHVGSIMQLEKKSTLAWEREFLRKSWRSLLTFTGEETELVLLGVLEGLELSQSITELPGGIQTF